MRTKDLIPGEYYAYAPCQWNKTYVPSWQWWRVRLLNLGCAYRGEWPRHEVVQVDDQTGEPLTYYNGAPRIFDAVPGELIMPWAKHIEEQAKHDRQVA